MRLYNIHHYDVTVIYVTLNLLLFNAVLSLDIGHQNPTRGVVYILIV